MNEFLTPLELARRLKISRAGLYRGLAAGTIPPPSFYPTVGAPRWRVKDVQTWLDERVGI